jgi:hypothetical protein
MAQRMSGNNWHPSALTVELDTGVECLIAKGRAVPARKDERRSREVYCPSPQPDPFNSPGKQTTAQASRRARE